MSSAVPEGWQVSPLGSLATVNWGNLSLTKDSYVETGFPAYSAAGNDGLVPNAEHTAVGVVLSAIGARCGRTFLTPQRWTAIKNTITILSGNQDIRFLYQVFNFNDVWNKSGGAQPFISLGDARKTPILHPPLPEQKKIASILTSVDEVIEKTQKQIDKLQDLKKATMNELLTKGIGHTEFKDSELGRIPKSWDSKRLGDVASLIMGQSPTSDTYNDNKNGTPFFQGKADFGVKHPKVRYWCTSPTKIAPVDSILFSVRAPVGAVNLNNVEACIGRGLASISGKSIDNTFLYQSLIHAKVKFEALGQGSTFEAINGNELKEFSLACPPLQEQKKIVSILTSMDKTIEEKQRKLAQTQPLKKSLMQDLLTGKVRVTVN